MAYDASGPINAAGEIIKKAISRILKPRYCLFRYIVEYHFRER